MKILRVFPRRTSLTPIDDMSFIGNPPMDRPKADEVHVSCVFTWDKQDHIEKHGKRKVFITGSETLHKTWSQYYPVVKLGGPAYDNYGDTFTPALYVKNGVVFTSRGCNNQCPWCLVQPREGKIRELPITIGNTIQDNNILQCKASHIDSVMEMLKTQSKISFTGGLEASRLTETTAQQIRSLKIAQLFFACDTPQAIKPLRKALSLLSISRDKVRCYVLLKHNTNETISGATERMIDVWNAGAIPFAQLYQPPNKHIEYSREWTQFSRIFQRPAATKGFMKKELQNDLSD